MGSDVPCQNLHFELIIICGMIHIHSSGSVGKICENSSATVNGTERHGTTPAAVTLLVQSQCVYKYIEQWCTYAH